MIKKNEALLMVAIVLIVAGAVVAGEHTLGSVASVISFVLFIPQAAVVWNARNDSSALAGVSVQTQMLLLANAVIWMFYAIETNAFWVGAPGIINGPLAIVTIALILRSRRTADNEHETITEDVDMARS